jgi:Na+-translocating ferredoxin:NAD+ oxidoreductase subunit E
MSQYQEIAVNGLWKQNPGVVQLLGLCPTLAMTTSMVNGFSLGLATAFVMGVSNAAVSPVRQYVPKEIRNPVFILIIAALVTIIDLSMNAFVHPLHAVLGIFIPLIVTNCIVLARVESFAAKNEPAPSFADGFMMGLGLSCVLTLLGGVRELIGKGTLLSGIELIAPSAKSMIIHVPDYHGFLIAVLPPGAFIGLGCLVALRNWAELRKNKTSQSPDASLKPAH